MVAWYLGGTLPENASAARVVVVLLEESPAVAAQQAGRALLSAALNIDLSPAP